MECKVAASFLFVFTAGAIVEVKSGARLRHIQMPKTIKSQAANALSHVISELPPQMVSFYFMHHPPQSMREVVDERKTI
jgi:hypothetical protein